MVFSLRSYSCTSFIPLLYHIIIYCQQLFIDIFYIEKFQRWTEAAVSLHGKLMLPDDSHPGYQSSVQASVWSSASQDSSTVVNPTKKRDASSRYFSSIAVSIAVTTFSQAFIR